MGYKAYLLTITILAFSPFVSAKNWACESSVWTLKGYSALLSKLEKKISKFILKHGKLNH